MGVVVSGCGSSYGWNATVRVCLAGSQEVRTVPLHIWDKFKTAAEAALNRDVPSGVVSAEQLLGGRRPVCYGYGRWECIGWERGCVLRT